MKEIVVTGAGGYIGNILVSMLLKCGYSVKAIDRFFFGLDKIAPHPNLTIVREDVRRIQGHMLKGASAVIDLAAISNDSSGQWFGKETLEINYKARVQMAQMAKHAGVPRYLLPSSCSIYGNQPEGVWVDETSQPGPLSNYAKANLYAENGVTALRDATFTVVVARQATVFGYSSRFRLDLVINDIVFYGWNHRKLRVMGNGAQWRPFVYVEDTAEAMIRLIEAESYEVNGEVFNVGMNLNNFKIESIAYEIKKILGDDVLIEFYGDSDLRSYKVRFDKIEKILGWRAKHSIRDGIQKMIAALGDGVPIDLERSQTLEWYKKLHEWHCAVRELEMYGGMLNIENKEEASDDGGFL